MLKQELLTKLAIKCPTWAAARSDLTWHNFQVSDEEALQIDESEWLAERRRLLNKPSWDNAPAEATHLALDDTRQYTCDSAALWNFYAGEPTRHVRQWLPMNGCVAVGEVYSALVIPAGYDWKESLEERPK